MRAWYLDTSALLKLVWNENESAAMRRWALQREEADDVFVSSDVATTEAIRVARRVDEEALPRAVAGLLDRLAMIRFDASLFEQAAYVGAPSLRSLDALHLAAAQEFRSDLAGVVAYDEGLLLAAAEMGLPTTSPR